MNSVLRQFLDQGVIVYIDDKLIYSGYQEDHEILVTEVVQPLQDEGLAGSPTERLFHVRVVEFPRYVISDKGASMSVSKLELVLSWGSPKCVCHVQVLLGFANVNRLFIKNFCPIAAPILGLTKGHPKQFH